MPSFRRENDRWFKLLTVLMTLSLVACTPTARTVARQESPLVLRDPLSTHTDHATLTVGTNRWQIAAAVLEEAFLPLAVTMHNTSHRSLCGGTSTASLHSPEGSAFSAVLPTSVVTRLFGPLAAVEHEFPSGPPRQPEGRQIHCSCVSKTIMAVLCPVVGYREAVYLGWLHCRSLLLPLHLFRLLSLPRSRRPSPPRSVLLPIHRSILRFTPHSHLLSLPRLLLLPLHPSRRPSPPHFLPILGARFAPFPPYPRYGYGYALPPLPPAPPFAEPPRPQHDQALMQEIVTAAFASRPLESQEVRTGFLFFPQPATRAQTLTLTWSWYDCHTHELMAHLSVPVDTRRP